MADESKPPAWGKTGVGELICLVMMAGRGTSLTSEPAWCLRRCCTFYTSMWSTPSSSSRSARHPGASWVPSPVPLRPHAYAAALLSTAQPPCSLLLALCRLERRRRPLAQPMADHGFTVCDGTRHRHRAPGGRGRMPAPLCRGFTPLPPSTHPASCQRHRQPPRAPVALSLMIPARLAVLLPCRRCLAIYFA